MLTKYHFYDSSGKSRGTLSLNTKELEMLLPAIDSCLQIKTRDEDEDYQAWCKKLRDLMVDYFGFKQADYDAVDKQSEYKKGISVESVLDNILKSDI